MLSSTVQREKDSSAAQQCARFGAAVIVGRFLALSSGKRILERCRRCEKRRSSYRWMLSSIVQQEAQEVRDAAQQLSLDAF